MNLKKEKEMFEAWYEKHHNGRQISCDYVYEDNSYSIGYANAMWIGWQASANRLGYKLVPVDTLNECLNWSSVAIWDSPSKDRDIEITYHVEIIEAIIGE